MDNAGGRAVATSPIRADVDPNIADSLSGDGSVTEELCFLTRRMSRALLRHPKLALFHHDSAAMYVALHEFFTQWSARQKRAAVLCLMPLQVESLLQYGESTIRRTALAGSGLSRVGTATELIAASPLIAIETLTQQLQSLRVRVVLSALAEVVELARVLDDAQGLRTPFGALNLVHLVALGATLCPAENMRALLLLVASSLEHRLLCAAVFYEWSLIDRSNAASLRALSKHVEQTPCDARLTEVVEELLDSTFSDLGRCPADPVIADTVLDGGACHMAPSFPSDVVTVKGNDEEGHAMLREDVNSATEDESETNDAVDVDFWRRLCS